MFLGLVKPMGEHNLPLPTDRDRINVSENLGKAAALPAFSLITPLYLVNFQNLKIHDCNFKTQSSFHLQLNLEVPPS